MIEEREKHSEYPKNRANISIIEIKQTEGEEEDIQFSLVIEEPISPSQVESWVKKIT